MRRTFDQNERLRVKHACATRLDEFDAILEYPEQNDDMEAIPASEVHRSGAFPQVIRTCTDI